MTVELVTPDKLSFKFYPINSKIFKFKVKAAHDVHIILSTSDSVQNPSYHIIIGGWKNTKTVIRKNEKDDVVSTLTSNVLSPSEYKGFWVSLQHEKTISVGLEESKDPFIVYTDSKPVPFSYVGVSTGWGASGEWLLNLPMIYTWQSSSNGNAPSNAFVAAVDCCNRKFHVIRASYNKALLPGKLAPGLKTAHVAWGGKEHECKEYEVLCNFNGNWQQCRNAQIPPKALPAGKSETGEVLYVGKVCHKGEICIGKVQPSHKCCYIPYGGKEYKYHDFEILISL